MGLGSVGRGIEGYGVRESRVLEGVICASEVLCVYGNSDSVSGVNSKVKY